ncbi:MAG: acyl-CoA dehydrogenase family protein [Mycobacteriales bacterium]
MDVRHTDAAERFRAELRSWLDANLPAEWREPRFWADQEPDEAFGRRRAWEAAKAAAGFAGIHWPTQYGGRGGTPAEKAVYDEEMALARAPETVNPLGLTFLAPTVMVYGTEQQKAEIIAPLLRAEVIWCQGFSEPGAGSDLAALSTRAERDGDSWVVNGQKVWTTNARHGDEMFALVRTDPQAPRHAGLSMLLIDMHSPGVEVRPLRQMTGVSEFGEVFFTDVRVPVDSLLGPVHRGWEVAMALLSFERGASAIGQYTRFRRELDYVLRAAGSLRRGGRPALEDPWLRQRLGHVVTELELLRLHSLHVLTQTERGRDLGFESSITKLQWSEAHQDLGELFMDLAGTSGQEITPELAGLQEMFLWSRSETIWGGSSQVQRTIVAERVLGLPR